MNTLLANKVRQKLPDGVRAIYSIEEAKEVFKKIRTKEGRVACKLRVISVQLYKASKAIDPKNLSWGPNDLPFYILRSNNVFMKSPALITMADLGELEDLYYATCGKLKELIERVNLHLQNNFKAPEDKYFTYTSKGFKHLGPIMVGEFKAFLLAQEEPLYHNGMVKMMTKAICQKSQRESTKALRNIRAKPCGMIFGELAEKYRPIVYTEYLEDLKKATAGNHHSPSTEQSQDQSDPPVNSVRPCSREEQGAEMPCDSGPKQARTSSTTPTPQSNGSLPIRATPSQPELGHSQLWYDNLTGGCGGSQDGTDGCTKADSAQAPSRVPWTKRLRSLWRRSHRDPQDVLQWIRIPDKRGDAPSRQNHEGIIFNDLARFVHQLAIANE